MTYAKLILPYNPTDNDVSVNPKDSMSLKGKLTSAMNNAGTALKNAITNPGQTMSTLGKYLQTNEDKILNKFSGIAMAQLLADGKIESKEALDYLFLGALPALNQTYAALGYSGIEQMKTALTDGSINVGQFVNGFTKTLKSGIDLKNKIENIKNFTNKNVIELDITYSHQEQYLSEAGDRRVQEGITWAEFIHNLPETYSLTCGIQDGKRYSVTEFKDTLKLLRQKRTPFSIEIDEELTDNVILLNFEPSREGATNGLEYTLRLKKVYVSAIDIVPITIQPLPTQDSQTVTTSSGSGKGSSSSKISSYNNNPYTNIPLKTPKSGQHKSLWAELSDNGWGFK